MPCYDLDGQRPVCHPSVWIAPSADLIADVRLAADVSVWFGAVIRADNTPITIGARSNVQEGAMLHSDPGTPLNVGKDCTIGHHAILHGCTIGDRVLIGMGAIILNRATVPNDCVVGAGSLVTEGKTFPPASLIVGSPARAVRVLDEEARAGLLRSAQHYVDRSRHYGGALKRTE